MKIAILDDYQDCALSFGDWSDILRQAEITTFKEPFRGADDIVGRLQNFDVLCLMRERTPLGRDVLARLPKLKHVVLTGRRSASLDVAYLDERGISLNTTDAGPAHHATPELAIGLIFALARNIPRGDALMKCGEWLTNAPLGFVLHGKVLGIIGLGKVGCRVAEIARAIGLDVIAWSPNLTPERAAAAGVRFSATKRELLATADIVSIHLVLAPSTIDMIGPAEFAQLKPSAVLINTARGPIVNETALLTALRNGSLAGAAIDVFDIEPLPSDHPLRTLRNCILLPHFGYVTREIYEAFYRNTAEALRRLLGLPEAVFKS